MTFTCADPGAVASGIATCTTPQTLGNAEPVTGHAVDRADNAASVVAGPFRVDTDAPTVTINGVANGGVYSLGSVPAGSCSATDVGASGLDGTCSFIVTGGLANGVGTFNYTANARDMAGNVTTTIGSYRVTYNIAQGTAFWLQPINDTAHTVSSTVSVFKAGSTVPAKFRLVDAAGRVIQTNTAPVWLTPVRGSATTAPVDEEAYALPSDSGSVFKWSATDQHYMFNWGSPKNGAGYFWRIGVKLDDGTTQTVSIGLR